MQIKTLVSYGIKYIGSISLFLWISSSILFGFLANPNYWNKIRKEQNYVEYLEHSIKEEMTNYLMPSGLKEEILDKIYTKEEIEIELQNLLKEEITEIDTSKVRKTLEENINNYLTKHNLQINQKEKDKFLTKMEKIYKDEITLYGYTNTIKTYLQKINKILAITISTSFLFTLFFFGIQIKIRKEPCMVISCFTTSFLLASIVIYCHQTMDISHINIFNPKVSKMITTMIEDILAYVQNISILLIIVVLLIFIIKKRLSKQRNL